MAILSFGATFRGANIAFALTNNTAQAVAVPALGLTINGNATEIVSFNTFDALMRSPRNTQVYDRNLKGGLYVDDVAALCALVQAGTLKIKPVATFNTTTNAFSAPGAALTITATADNSVIVP